MGSKTPCPYGRLRTRPLNSAAAKHRVCPSIPPAGIGGTRTLTLPDRRSAGAVRGEAVCQRPPRLSSLGPRKPQSGEGSGSSFYSVASVSLAGGWQDRWLLLMSGNTFKNAKRECEKSSRHQRQQTFRTLNECRHSSLFSPMGCDKHSTTGNLPSKGYTAPYKLLPVNAAISYSGRSGITYNLNNVCNAGAPRSQVQWIRLRDFSEVRTSNQSTMKW